MREGEAGCGADGARRDRSDVHCDRSGAGDRSCLGDDGSVAEVLVHRSADRVVPSELPADHLGVRRLRLLRGTTEGLQGTGEALRHGRADAVKRGAVDGSRPSGQRGVRCGVEVAMSVLDGVDRRPQDGLAALEALNTVAERLYERGDPRAAFPEIYGVITRRAALEARSANGGFLEPAWIYRLMGRFCERYLETLAWSEAKKSQDCTAWKVTYEYARRGLTIPFQDVVLGLSAHINYDLPIGISQTIREFGDSPEKVARYKHDHDHINTLLRESVPECFERVADRYGCRTGQTLWQHGGRVTESIVLTVLSVWRGHIWNDVLALLDARDEYARRRAVARMEWRSGMIARAIVAPSASLELAPATLRGALSRALVVPAPRAMQFTPLTISLADAPAPTVAAASPA